MAQRNKIYQALATQSVLVSVFNFIVGFGLFTALLQNKKTTKYQQPYYHCRASNMWRCCAQTPP